jgi:UDP-N-acetylmuramoyl-tripeptide--D-alanyl-D-alanine ligase
MQLAIHLLSFVALFFYVTLLLKEELHMMQLNSYFNERYIKWLKENVRSRYDLTKLTVLASIVVFYFYSHIATASLIFAASAWGCVVLLRKKSKKKLDFTPRATRLYIVELLLVILALVAVHFTVSAKYFPGLLFVVVGFSFVIMILANILIRPIEKMINQGYINDAKKTLASRPELIKIGITGSYGKTSVKHFLHAIMSEKYNTLMTPGSYNTTLGVVRTVREYLQAAHEVFIIEMGAKKIGDIQEICDIAHPRYGIITAIGPQHLETFGSIDNVRKGKFELIASLPGDGIGFINGTDLDPNNLPAPAQAKIITFSATGNTQYKGANVAYKGLGMHFDVYKGDEKVLSLQTKLLGEHNVSNLVAACAVGLELGVETYLIEKAVKQIEAVNHRLEVSRLANGVTIIDDAFNSNPVGSRMAVEALRRFEGNQKIIITPGMIELGAKEYELNFEFGIHIAKNCDLVFLVGASRTKPIQEGLKSVNFPDDKLYVCKNLQEANDKVKTLMKAGDVVLYENDLPDTFNE